MERILQKAQSLGMQVIRMADTRCSASEFGETLGKVIRQYSDEVIAAMPEAVEKAVKVCKKKLKEGAPYRSGAYKSSFKSKKQKADSSVTSYEIYSTKPGLPHLLEHGHVIKNQHGKVYGVSQAIPHWAPAEEAAAEELEKEIRQKAEEAG